MSVQAIGIATTPLAAYMLLEADQKWLATAPLFLIQLGTMTTTIPASLLMGIIGRRAGFSMGALMGIGAGSLGVIALYRQSFGLMCASALLQGMQAAFFWYFRLAAADASEPDFRARAISLVMVGGAVAGLLGPQTAKWTVDWLAPVTFAGIYAAMAVFSLAVLLLVQLLRIARLSPLERAAGGRPMRTIAGQPAYRLALAASVCGYAVMTLTMSATPLAMLACGFGFSDSATVIQAHIIAMFLPSLVTGHLIARFGVLPVIATGGLLGLACATINLSGVGFANFLVANVLVGLGWNFTYIGGSTLLTSTYTPAERAKVQASHDFVVFAATAVAAGLSGVLQAQAGWSVINIAGLPLMTAVIGSAAWMMMRRGRTDARAAG